MSALLEAEDLSYRTGSRTLVDGIDLTFAGGTFSVVIGPNGAGRSTLLRLLCGELQPTRGAVRRNGEPLRMVQTWRLAHRRAVMPQASDLGFPFTVVEVASLGTEGIGRGLSGHDRQRLALAALEQADVVHLAQLAAGRTLETNQVLFLDEPIASLDLKHQLTLLETAKNLSRGGLAVIAVLHDLQLAAGLADDLILLQCGRLAARGTPSAVLTPTRLAEIFGVTLASYALPPTPWRLAMG